MRTPLPPLVEAYFVYLTEMKGCADATRASYADAFKLLFSFAAKAVGKQPCRLDLEDLDSRLVVDFLGHLEKTRHNSVATRNLRLATIRSFFAFIQYRVPSALAQVLQILTIPKKRTVSKLVSHLTRDEMQRLLEQPKARAPLGIRDRAMLLVALTAGLRASEVITLRLADVSLDANPTLLVLGKGKRQRAMPLDTATAQALRAWMAIRPAAHCPELFLNARGQPMSRSGWAYIVRQHASAAKRECASMATKRVSPHVLRHTCAMMVLHATRDLRKVALWLGHANIQTTEVYLRADPTEKLAVLQAAGPISLPPGIFQPPDPLLRRLAELALCRLPSHSVRVVSEPRTEK